MTPDPTAGGAHDGESTRPAAPRAGRLGEALTGDDFSFAEAVGGWRGLVESAAPGLVFVVAYLTWGGWRVPVIASVATVAVLVILRLIQRSSVQQALAGVLGVGIGAIWAWRSGDAGGYFVPGLWANGLYLAGLLISMAVRWPAVGIVVGLLKGWGSAWRADARVMRVMQLGTAVVAGMFAIRLAVQLPLYLAGAIAPLGTAKLAMGVPLFALTLWVVWLLVRNAAPDSTPQDPPPTTR